MRHCLGFDFDPNKAMVDGDGYSMLYVPWHPNCWKSSKSLYLHRLIMESNIGRLLAHDEHIHHKDGNRSNNLIDNLEIITKTNHYFIHHSSPALITYCIICGKIVKRTKYNKYCSHLCSFIGKQRVSDSDIISIYQNNQKLPMYKIAKLLSISNVALKKRLIRLGIIGQKIQDEGKPG